MNKYQKLLYVKSFFFFMVISIIFYASNIAKGENAVAIYRVGSFYSFICYLLPVFMVFIFYSFYYVNIEEGKICIDLLAGYNRNDIFTSMYQSVNKAIIILICIPFIIILLLNLFINPFIISLNNIVYGLILLSICLLHYIFLHITFFFIILLIDCSKTFLFIKGIICFGIIIYNCRQLSKLTFSVPQGEASNLSVFTFIIYLMLINIIFHIYVKHIFITRDFKL